MTTSEKINHWQNVATNLCTPNPIIIPPVPSTSYTRRFIFLFNFQFSINVCTHRCCSCECQRAWCVFVLLCFICCCCCNVRIDSNPELFPEHHPLPPLLAVALPAIHDHDDTTPLVIVVTLLLLLLGLFYQCAMIVCMCDTIQGEHLFCCSSSVALFLIASLSRGVHSIMQRRRRSRASVLVCACLFACGHRCADVCVCVLW